MTPRPPTATACGFISRRKPPDEGGKEVKSSHTRHDSKDTSTTNELIAVIDSARAKGNGVKSIRKQKYAPADFYMTLTDGKQVGPVNCAGNIDELNRKFGEAQSYLAGMKNLSRTGAAASK